MSRTDPALENPVLPSLTGLRWVAAFGVFAYHVRNLGYFDGNAQNTLSAVVGSGDTGVSLFFMLSGFVLAWSDRTDGDSAGPVRAALTFWCRRAARIWPLHLVALLAAIVVGATLMPSIRTTSPAALVANVLLVNAWHAPWWQAGNPVSWSLACEAFFYLTFPFLIRPIRRAHPAVLTALAVLAAVLVLVAPVLVPHLPGSPVPASWPPARFPEFLLGVLAAALVRSGAWRGPRLAVPVLLTVAGLLAADLHPTSGLALTGCTVVGFSLLLPALARADAEGRSTGLSSPLLVRLGTRSFAFYLVHLLTIDAVLAFRPRGAAAGGITSALMALLALVVAMAVATVLHDAVEVPARRLLLRGLRPAARRGPEAGRTDEGFRQLIRPTVARSRR
ncbi:acyltransferase family protein [Curtobacterium flaccumfaciens]|uniref:acyltransferase family protein n=1 Tax=Curtobacterium flaccumfaciens TaxID=2035 RepID=UPI001BDEEFF8|nr:acyltransferase [Curtobacterium flaccumfaciens]MBT1672889.1 acyltransferase [Curtobacterium flaccumfaciens pv. flaccumfaciens]